MKLKYLIASFLMISGVMAICFDSLTKGFVTFSPYGIDEYVYLRDMQGSSDDDSVLVGFFGIISIIVSLVIVFLKNLKYVIRIGFLNFIFLFFLMLLVENDSFFSLIANTIHYNHNIYLILWCIFFAMYSVSLVILNTKNR